MTTPRTIAEQWDDALVDLPIDIGAEDLAQARRMFYRGALAAATCGLTREQLMAELVAHGRGIGSSAEKAPTAAPRVDARAVALMRRG